MPAIGCLALPEIRGQGDNRTLYDPAPPNSANSGMTQPVYLTLLLAMTAALAPAAQIWTVRV